MDIDDAARRDVDDRLRNDLAVTDHDHGVRFHLVQLLDDLRTPDAFGLVYRQSKSQSGFFHRRCGHFAAATLRAIRLREHCRYAMASFDDTLQCGNRKAGSAHKNQDHSPAFTSLRTLRRIKSRLRALTWLMYRRPFRWSISWQNARASSSSPFISNHSPWMFCARTVTLLGRVTCSRNPGRLRQPSSPV